MVYFIIGKNKINNTKHVDKTKDQANLKLWISLALLPNAHTKLINKQSIVSHFVAQENLSI